MNSNNQGNGLLVVLIIISAIAFGVYSVSDLITSEFRLNKRANAYNEAKQAAESLIQHAIVDLHTRFENSGVITEDTLAPINNPLFISNEFISLYPRAESNLVIPEVTRYSSASEFFSEDTEVIGGRVSPVESLVINLNETGNERDPQAGLNVNRQTVEIFGKATIDKPVLGRVTVHAKQLLEIRDIPLFGFAIYYNLPMEIAPGPDMNVFGNVHVNGDAWFQVGTGNELNFHGRVSIAGDIHHGRHPSNPMGIAQGAVNFTNDEGVLTNMRKSDDWPAEAKESFSGTWLESIIGGDPFEDFYELSNQIWNGNLNTKDHGVESIILPGVTEYVEDTDPDTRGNQAFNSAYTIIQPTLNEIEVPSASSDYEAYQAAQALRAAENHKFSYKAGLTIEVGNDGSLNYYTYERDSYDRILYNSDGSPKRIALAPSVEIASPERFSASGETIESGLRDLRQEQDMNLINVDVSVLTDLVHKNNAGDWGGGTGNVPEDWWNGVVYVKFPQENATSTRPDNVNRASANNWGVKLVNGDTIPNPSFAQENGIFGTSIATNQVMYVEGNYNSDGDISTGSPTQPDNADTFNEEGQEAPAALAADAITFLSENWNDSNSDKNLATDRVAAPTEVSAAILTGLVPSGKTGSNSYSGGVENFPRFLENWRGKEFVMRGSIVAMFESEVANNPWQGGVYNAPKRNWGFHQNYIETPPPGSPRVRTYRGRDFQILSQEEYQARVIANWPEATLPPPSD